MDCLTLLLNVNEGVELSDEKHNKILKIEDLSDFNHKDSIKGIFPDIVNDDISATDAMDFFINVTNDINETTEKRNKLYENTFGKKFIFVTYVLIAINVIIYLLQMLDIVSITKFAMNKQAVISGEYYRLFTAAFLHGGVIHLLCNMYSLYLIGTELETVLGKVKFIVVYLLSIVGASLLSGVMNGAAINAVGASGAIFGLLGALVYFGIHYRLYLGNALLYQIVPVIALNLFIGFSSSGIDNWGHIGGLAAGYLAAMIVGINGKENKTDKINGIIVYILLIIFLCYMLFFR